MRYWFTYNIPADINLPRKIISLYHSADPFIMLSSNGYSHDPWAEWDLLCGAGKIRSVSLSAGDWTVNPFMLLENFRKECDDWVLGHLNYDLKNFTEDLSSHNHDDLMVPEMSFFQPEILIGLKGGKLMIGIKEDSEENAQLIKSEILNHKPTFSEIPKAKVIPRITREEFIQNIHSILGHIKHGDIYEMNFCQEFYINPVRVDPIALYEKLIRENPVPFSALYRFGPWSLVSASPERFMKKINDLLISQPIKGTQKRGADPDEDIRLIEELRNHPKERSENIMIVDLVRNDLSIVACKGSVKVDELCGIYTFPTLHQMISTVSARIRPEFSPTDAIRASFPMGSMTGAPKIKAMQLIEKYEETKRGIYSGAVGYIDPEGNFDFNVVIRSMVCRKDLNHISFITGGAITSGSDPEHEYEETLLKAKAIKNLFQ